MVETSPAPASLPAPPGPETADRNPSRPSSPRRLAAWVRRHRPELLLVALSITIPELLTGSTPVFVLFNPISLAFLLGLYGAGVLLIRETAVRRGGGWPMILLLGGAYAFAEEAVGTKTYFDAALVGATGAYGHFAGVNWMWLFQLTIFHAVFSIGLPILVVGIVYPGTVGRGWFSDRAYRELLAIFALTVLAMFALFGWGWHLGWPYVAGSLAAIGAFVLVATRSGPGFPRLPAWPGPGSVPASAAAGAVFVWSFFAINWLGPSAHLPPEVLIVGMTGLAVATLAYIVPRLSGADHADRQLAFTAGALSFLFALSLFTLFGGNYLILVVDAILLWAFVRWARPFSRTAGPTVPGGAMWPARG